MRILMLALVAAAGCSNPNPDACCTTADQCLMYGLGGITDCDSSRVCNMNGNCVVPMCKVDTDCNDASMVCDMYGQCVPGNAARYTLTVQIAGSGGGTITSTPPGITCTTGTCTGTFDAGTEVQLAQSATTGSFLGWAYGCRGTDTCSVTLSSDQRVGALFGVAGEGLWTKQVTAGGNDSGNDLVSTVDGDLIAVGSYAGTLDLDSFTLMSGDDTVSNSYVAKLDGWTGKAIWAKSFPLGAAARVGLDPDGQMYVVGTFSGTADLGGGQVLNSAGGTDVYVLKLSQTGDLVWSYSLGGSDDERAFRIAVAAGVVVIVIGTSTYSTIVAINAVAGTPKWAKPVPPGTAFGLGIDTSNILVSGSFSTAYDFGSGTVTPIGTSDAFVARYVIATGALAAVNHDGAASQSQFAFGVAKDVAGNTIVSGKIFGSAINQLYVTKQLVGGSTAWNETLAVSMPTGNGAIPLLAFSETGDVVIAGTFCGTVTIGVDHAGPFCSAQAPRFGSFISTLRNGTGDPLASTILVPDARVFGISKASTDGRSFATGEFSSSVTFPTQILVVAPAVGKFDSFVMASAP